MKSLLAAIAFLTVIPIPVKLLDKQQDYKKCVPLFPIVGLMIGGLIALAAWGLVLILPTLPAAVMVMSTMIVITGALHLDGLADTADGFLSSCPRDQIMEIMRDSRIGAMGVVALLIVLLLKVALLCEVCGMEISCTLSTVALTPVIGRCSLIWSMQLNPYARQDGLGESYWIRSWVISLIALAGVIAFAFWLVGISGLIGAAFAICVTLVFSLWCWRKIGGATGDTAGACCELAETAFLLAVVSVVNLGGTP